MADKTGANSRMSWKDKTCFVAFHARSPFGIEDAKKVIDKFGFIEVEPYNLCEILNNGLVFGYFAQKNMKLKPRAEDKRNLLKTLISDIEQLQEYLDIFEAYGPEINELCTETISREESFGIAELIKLREKIKNDIDMLKCQLIRGLDKLNQSTPKAKDIRKKNIVYSREYLSTIEAESEKIKETLKKPNQFNKKQVEYYENILEGLDSSIPAVKKEIEYWERQNKIESSKGGRKGFPAFQHYIWFLADVYEKYTGKKATIIKDKVSNKNGEYSGGFFNFVIFCRGVLHINGILEEFGHKGIDDATWGSRIDEILKKRRKGQKPQKQDKK